MPQDTWDQSRRHVEGLRRVGTRRLETGHDGRVGDAAGGVGLGVEEDLGVADAVGVGALEIRHREGVEVEAGEERGHADEVVVQEVVEGGELAVAGGEGGGGGEGGVGGGESDGVLGGEGEEEGWLERAFDVQVVLAFGEGGEEGV